jgi:GAF domain-containing protein
MKAEEICRELDRLEKDDTPFETLLETGVDLLHASDERFHWTGLYELFHDNVLRLGPYVGDATSPETLGVGRTLRGAAIAGRRSIVVNDILRLSGDEAGFGPGARLMVPIRTPDEIFGEIEVESFLPEAFDEEGLRAVEAVADRLAAMFGRERKLVLAGV